METFGKILILKNLIITIIVLTEGKTVDILTSAGLPSSLEDEEILRILGQNKSQAFSENFTFVELVGSLRNHTEIIQDNLWTTNDIYKTNPYYDDFSVEIDQEARRLLQILPAFDPGAGHVSSECKRQSDIFHRELSKFSLWALKMYDATAKMPSGLLNGNVNQFGDFDECIGIEGSEGIRGQYCLAYLQLDFDQSRPDLKYLHRLLHSHYAFRSNFSDPGHRVPRFSTINWAICTPAACSPHDVESSLRHAVTNYASQTGFKISVKVEREMCQVQRTESYTRETITVGLFFLGIVLFSTMAGVCDLYDIPTNNIVQAFSLSRNLKKLISTNRSVDDIGTLHGVRFLNALMLIVAHKSMALFFNPYANRTEMSEYLGKPWTVLGRAASLYTDPFIMISGLLTSYSFVGRLNRNGKLNISNEYISRLMRLVPTLGALILFCTYIMPFIGSGPQWNLVVTHHADICKKTWWRNFLFIHNYFGFENMCLTHTHHLGIDTQLFAISPLFIILLYKRPKIGAIILTGIAVFSTFLRYYITYFRRLNNYVFFGTSIRQLFDTANFSYILPSHRLTVYIIGIFLGYLLRNYPKGFKLNQKFTYVGWTLSSLLCLAAFVGPAPMGAIDYIYNPVHAATYNAFAPIGWCALFGWLAFVSHTGNTNSWISKLFSWKGFLITTRLSYAIYLTQFPVFFFNVGQTRTAENYGFFRMIFNFKELFWIVFTAAILTLFFDMPFQNIKTILLKKPKSSGTEKSSKVE
ncbi:O-acyltransferase like protein-like [Leptopilina heterotoma]|uniref:O-acyltransferase like protein-like n=1 Tax=Leptopilina heterotoma TaxID=63436 RepID=UPI001CA80931|nr:O-acyltransferase like protein-like [Leptopilina heterotoma]